MTAQFLIRVTLLCVVSTAIMAAPQQRWYSEQQRIQGTQVFKQNCAVCHGTQAESTPNWKQKDANGFYPPPPLNGSAHAWHHSLDSLRGSLRDGGTKIGGMMPSFENVLTTQQRDSAIAFFQSQWDDDLYKKWSERFPPPSNSSTTQIETNPIFNPLKQRLGINTLPKAVLTADKQLYQITVNGSTIYVTKDGQYALIGNLIELKTGENLTPKP